MRKVKRIMASMLLALTIVSNGITVMASGGCTTGSHQSPALYESIFRYRVKTDEHEVILSNGMSAVCYVYTEYYDNRYYCSSCNTYYTKPEAYENRHSITHY